MFRTAEEKVERAWRSRHYVETAAKRGLKEIIKFIHNFISTGGSIPVNIVLDANLLLSIGSNFQQLIGSDLEKGRKLWTIPLQSRATRLWVKNNVVVLLCGGPVEKVKSFEILKF